LQESQRTNKYILCKKAEHIVLNLAVKTPNSRS